jgi:deoxycytidylate deaminase
MIINAGIRTVVYLDGYADELSLDLIAKSKVELIEFNEMGKKP